MQVSHARLLYRVRTGDRVQIFDFSGSEPRIFEADPSSDGADDDIPDYERIFGEADCKTIISKEAVTSLGKAMISSDIEPDDDGVIPAGYTYLGQLIFHDITWFKSEAKSSASAALDLDSILGNRRRDAKPAGICPLHGPLAIGLTSGDADSPEGPLPEDLPRLGPGTRPRAPEEDAPGFPLIPDFRNDDFLPLSQLHLKVLKFYNAVARWHGFSGSHSQRERIRKCVIQHVQSVVLSDYLPMVASGTIYEDVMKSGRRFVHVDTISIKSPFRIPLEFATAVGRFGHSMIRSLYDWNSIHHSASLAQFLEFSHRNSLPSPPPDGPKMMMLDRDWVIDWTRFFEPKANLGASARPPNFANRIDTRLVHPLSLVPERIRTSGAASEMTFNLAETTLSRQRDFHLATAQSAIRQMNSVLHADEIPLLEGRDLTGAGTPAEAVFDAYPELYEKTPLWYYILREAKLLEEGRKLGPMGSRLLVETIHAAIEASEFSILREAAWEPCLPRLHSNKFQMADLLIFCGNPAPM